MKFITVTSATAQRVIKGEPVRLPATYRGPLAIHTIGLFGGIVAVVDVVEGGLLKNAREILPRVPLNSLADLPAPELLHVLARLERQAVPA